MAIRGGFTYTQGQAALWAQDEEGLAVRLEWPATYAAAENADAMRDNL